MNYQIQNLLHTSLIIEDIGVTLQAIGGQDSIRIIPDRLYTSSRLLIEYQNKKWVRISVCNQEAPRMPIWPFSKPPAAPPPIPPPPPPSSPVQVSSPASDEVRALRGSVDILTRKINELLQQGPIFQAPIQAYRAPVQDIPDSLQTVDEPMFLPSSIVPKTADVRIQVTETESESKDFDSSLDALKQARKRK